VQKFPPNATDMIQPADSFIIQKIKQAWSKRWEDYKHKCINTMHSCDEEAVGGSGKIHNPGKRFFLQLAADAIRDVNNQRDRNETEMVCSMLEKQ